MAPPRRQQRRGGHDHAGGRADDEDARELHVGLGRDLSGILRRRDQFGDPFPRDRATEQIALDFVALVHAHEFKLLERFNPLGNGFHAETMG